MHRQDSSALGRTRLRDDQTVEFLTETPSAAQAAFDAAARLASAGRLREAVESYRRLALSHPEHRLICAGLIAGALEKLGIDVDIDFDVESGEAERLSLAPASFESGQWARRDAVRESDPGQVVATSPTVFAAIPVLRVMDESRTSFVRRALARHGLDVRIRLEEHHGGTFHGEVHLGDVQVMVVGVDDPIEPSMLERVAASRSMEHREVGLLFRHRAHVVIRHEAGGRNASERYLALYRIAAAFGELGGLLGIVNPIAQTFAGPAEVNELLATQAIY